MTTLSSDIVSRQLRGLPKLIRRRMALINHALGRDISQHREVSHLKNLIKPDFPQYLVDVGAFDGVLGSNSYFFVQAGWKATLIEAAAAALPVVAVNEGGGGETIVHGETGLLVPADPAQLGGAILSLLDNINQARVMGASGRERVNRLNRWEMTAQEFM